MSNGNDPTLHSVKLDLELLKKDVTQISTICEKLDVTIDKIQELAATMTRMLSLHEQKIEKQEQNDKELFSLVELRRVELLSDIKELNTRVSGINKEFNDKLQNTEDKLIKAVQDLKKEITEKSDTNKTKLSDAIESINRWKWMIIGGAVVVGYIISITIKLAGI